MLKLSIKMHQVHMQVLCSAVLGCARLCSAGRLCSACTQPVLGCTRLSSAVLGWSGVVGCARPCEIPRPSLLAQCNILLNLLLLLLKDVDMHYNQNLKKTRKTRPDQDFSENVWSEAHVFLCFFSVYFCGFDIKKQKMRLDFFKGCIASVHILYFSARILLLILRGYLVFKAITLF